MIVSCYNFWFCFFENICMIYWNIIKIDCFRICYLLMSKNFNIFQVYQYFTIYRRFILLKFEKISWISYKTLIKIRRYQIILDLLPPLMRKVYIWMNLGAVCYPVFCVVWPVNIKLYKIIYDLNEIRSQLWYKDVYWVPTYLEKSDPGWYDISKLLLPNTISLLEGSCLQRSDRTQLH